MAGATHIQSRRLDRRESVSSHGTTEFSGLANLKTRGADAAQYVIANTSAYSGGGSRLVNVCIV